MWSIWFRSELSSGKDFEILWKFVIFQSFISTVLSNLHSTDVIPHCTEYPPQYWRYPPLYWYHPLHVLMLSPNVLKVSLRSTDVIPLHVLILSPTILNNLHNTEAIPPQYWSYPPQYWCYPPMYWITSNVQNNLHSTEPTSYGVVQSVPSAHWPPLYFSWSLWVIRNVTRWIGLIVLSQMSRFYALDCNNIELFLHGLKIWRGLVGTYKSTKDLKRRNTSSGPKKKVVFYEKSLSIDYFLCAW